MENAASHPVFSGSPEEGFGAIMECLYREEGFESLTSILQAFEALPVDYPRRSELCHTAHRAIAVYRRLEQHKLNERRLRAVFESAQALTELKELKQVLFEIVERGRGLLGSDLAWLAGINSADGSLLVLAIDGTHTQPIRSLSTTAGVAGYVLKTRGPFTTSDYLNDSRFEHDPQVDVAIAGEGLQSLVAVPLLSNAEIIGILIVGDRYTRTYLPWEMSILSTLAVHASIAFRNAHAYDLTRDALRRAEHSNTLLREQTETLEFAVDAHDRLAQLLAKGSNLKDLMQLISNTLNGYVTFIDVGGIELAVATPPGYDTPEVQGNANMFSGRDAAIQAAVSESRIYGRSVPTEVVAGDPCRVTAVMSGDELLGAIVIRTPVALAPAAIRIFERSATATAVLMLSAQKKTVSSQQDVNLTIRGLLAPTPQFTSESYERARLHGLNLSAALVLVAIEIESVKVGYCARKLGEHLGQQPALVTELDGYIVVLVNSDNTNALQNDLDTLLFRRLRLTGVAVVSGPHTDYSKLAEVYANLKRSVRLLHALRRENCVIHERALGMYSVLFQPYGADELDKVIDSIIGPLIAYDSKKGTHLVDTLLAYLDHQHNARATAKNLGIHVNTLHNRLDGISAVLGLWNTDGRSVEIHLALRLRTLRGRPSVAR